MTDGASPVLAIANSFSWNPVADWQALTGQAYMRDALLAGTIAAAVCGVIGYFVVMRGLTFAADALTHIGFTGASGAVLLGLSPVAGLLALTMATAVGIGALQQRMRGRDVVTGMILVEALGLGVLFLRLSSGYSNQTYALLFGNILALSVRDLVVLGVAGAVALLAIAAVFRPLLFASLDEEVAESRGVPVRRLGIGFVVIVAIAAAAATQVVGALLAVILIVAPAASAQRLTHRPLLGIALSVIIALLATWCGIAIAFWQPYPVSFFITSLAAVVWGVTRLLTARRFGSVTLHHAHAHAH
ncbi:MAG TPA: metal ABC transporter permease [Candidatus Dormibacteraeota bacterium]|jgi:zinc/manganese transport system permease protein|nr:metal ABC transporter permease [Candidatus Dormibacteraeota bacterium]